SSTTTQTYPFSSGSVGVATIAVHYDYEQALNTLTYSITATNASPYILNGFGMTLLSGIQFPGNPTDASGNKWAQPNLSLLSQMVGGLEMAFGGVNPSSLLADFGSGALVAGVEQPTPNYLSFWGTSDALATG